MVKIERWGFGAPASQASNSLSMGGFYNDPSFQFGVQDGWSTRDVAPGKYEILDGSGSSLGFGYKSVMDTLADYQRQNILGSIREDGGKFFSDYLFEKNPEFDYRPNDAVSPGSTMFDQDTGEYFNIYGFGDGERIKVSPYRNAAFNSRDEITASLQALYDQAAKPSELYGWGANQFGGDLGAWEALGNMIAGGGKPVAPTTVNTYSLTTGMYQVGNYLTPLGGIEFAESGGVYAPGSSNHNARSAMAFGLPTTYRGNMPATERVEEIAGENALFGSVPVFKDGRLVGYKIDTTVLDQNDFDALQQNHKPDGDRSKHSATENSAVYNWNRRSSSTLNAVAREYNIGWNNLAKPMDQDGNVFVSASDVSKIPGWKNHATASYENWAGGGFLEKILPSIALAFVPGGQFVAAGMALDNKNPLGAVMSLAGGLSGLNGGFAAADAAQLAGQGLSTAQIANTIGSGGLLDYAAAVGGKYSNAIGSISAATKIPANVVNGALRGAVSGGISGGKEGALVGGLIGGAASGASNLVDGDFSKIAVGTITANLLKMGYSQTQAEDMAKQIKSASSDTRQSKPTQQAGGRSFAVRPIEKWGF